MLYQLGTAIDGLIISLDIVAVGLLLYLIRYSHRSFTTCLTMSGVTLLMLLLAGFKLLFSSAGTLASTPGLVVVRNPERHPATLYYLQQYPEHRWRVVWVEYRLGAGAETVMEAEGSYGVEVAYEQAGQWHYAPARLSAATEAELTFPQDFAAVDTSGRIAAVVAAHRLTETSSWLSNLLTVAGVALLATLIVRLSGPKSRLVAPA